MKTVKLRDKLVLYFAIVILISSLSIGALSLYESNLSLTKEKQESFENIAKEIHFNVDNVIREAIHEISILANNQIFFSNSSPEEIRATLIKSKKIITKYEDIILTDMEGNVITATDYVYSGKVGEMNIVKEALEGKYSASNVVWAVSPMRAVILIAGPIYHDEKPIGALILQLNMEKISSIIKHVNIGDTGFAFLVDENDKIIAHKDKEKIFTNFYDLDLSQEDYGKLDIKEGKDNYKGVFYSNKDSDTVARNWKVVILQEQKELSKPIRSLMVKNSIIASIAILIGITIAAFLSKKVVDPILAINESTKKIVDGDYSQKIKEVSGDEVGQLAKTYNKMVEALKASREKLEKYNKNLQKEVNSRTKELKLRNEDLEDFNKMVIGRELKMVELKKKIKALEKEISIMKKSSRKP